MHPYFLLAGVLVSLSGVLIIFYILAFRYYFLEKERNQLVTLVFHQLYELLRSTRWHTSVFRRISKVPADKIQHLDTIDSGIDEILQKHAAYFPREHGQDPAQQSMSLVGKMLRQSKVPDVLHDFLDLLTAIKWETEILAYDPKAKTPTIQMEICHKIDEGIDDTISLMDRFLRISGRQQRLSELTTQKIIHAGTGEVLTREQKDMLKLGA
jgi:hypothetical protein